MRLIFLAPFLLFSCSIPSYEIYKCSYMNLYNRKYDDIIMASVDDRLNRKGVGAEIVIQGQRYAVDFAGFEKNEIILHQIANEKSSIYFLTPIEISAEGSFDNTRYHDKKCYFTIEKLYKAKKLVREDDIKDAYKLFYNGKPVKKF